jgi:hypothetical protein
MCLSDNISGKPERRFALQNPSEPKCEAACNHRAVLFDGVELF